MSGCKECKCNPEHAHFKGKDAVLKTAATKKQCKGTGTKIGAPTVTTVKEK